VETGSGGDIHSHLFKRPDGNQILFIYDKQSPSTVEVRLQTGESMNLDGTSREHTAFDGSVLSEIRLTPDQVAIFRIDP
jgi:polysaccharide biosynthesis protein PslG